MEEKVIRLDLSGVNCYLVEADDGYILFDTGGNLILDKEFTNRRQILIDKIEKAGVKPGDLKLVVITHGDIDHVANAAYIREKYNTKIAMHKKDSELVENPQVKKMINPAHFKSLAFKAAIFIMKRMINKIMVKTYNNFERFTPDIFVDEGYNLIEYGLDAVVLHIPGHTPGSIGILFKNGEFISGDIFANLKKPGTAPNAFDFDLMKESVERLKGLNIKKIFPGHGAPFEAKELNYRKVNKSLTL